MKATIKDVASKAGLSIVTVSRVINGVSTVRVKNRQLVLKAMKELNYQPSAAARTLSKGKTGVIGLLIAHLTDSFIAEVINSISEYLEKKSYFLALSVLPEDESIKDCYLFTPDRADGIILLSPYNEKHYVDELKKREIPLLIIDNNEQYSYTPTVSVDDFQGGYEVTRHLIELGHQNIAHVSGSDSLASSRQRKAGFLKALEENDLSPFDIIKGNYSILAGYQAAYQWIKKKHLPTAVFAADDQTAFGIIDAFRENNIKVPADISVAGYDNHPYSQTLHPFLTTVKQPTHKLGEKSVELLLEQIKSNNKRAVNLYLKPNLIVRQSTCKYRC